MTMKMAIYTFVPVSRTSKATGHTIASFISDVTGCTLSHRVDDCLDADVLGLMPGAQSYCNEREALGALIARVPRVVWIQDDYTCRVPAGGDSPWRKGFQTRLDAGLEPVHYWTTVHMNTDRTPLSALLNWNVVGYRKREPVTDIAAQIFYYGVWRNNRRKFAERYFSNPSVPVTISSKAGNEYSQKFPACQHVPNHRRTELVDWMRRSGVGLMLEDAVSTQQKNSPPRRFYEMLGAGVPMAFMPESIASMEAYGYDVRECVARDGNDLTDTVVRRASILDAQQTWCRDYRRELRTAVRNAYEAVTS